MGYLKEFLEMTGDHLKSDFAHDVALGFLIEQVHNIHTGLGMMCADF